MLGFPSLRGVEGPSSSRLIGKGAAGVDSISGRPSFSFSDMNISSFYRQAVSDGVTAHAHQWGSLAYCSQERLVYRKAIQYLNPGARCLDWGCGNGHFSYFLKINGFAPHALSLDDAPYIVRQQAIPHSRGMNPVDLPFPDNSFPAVFGLGVLEHVRELNGNEPDSLRELARILEPGGLLFIFHLPNKWSALEFAARQVNRDKAHVYRYSLSDARRLFVGFEILEHGRYHFIPRRLVNSSRLRDSILACDLVDAADDVLSFFARPICQNWFFILRKPLKS